MHYYFNIAQSGKPAANKDIAKHCATIYAIQYDATHYTILHTTFPIL